MIAGNELGPFSAILDLWLWWEGSNGCLLGFNSRGDLHETMLGRSGGSGEGGAVKGSHEVPHRYGIGSPHV